MATKPTTTRGTAIKAKTIHGITWAAYFVTREFHEPLEHFRRDVWGQYLSHCFGRRVVRVELRPDGTARRITTVAAGFAHPLALLVDRRGGLLVANWGRGVVYRIQARGS